MTWHRASRSQSPKQNRVQRSFTLIKRNFWLSAVEDAVAMACRQGPAMQSHDSINCCEHGEEHFQLGADRTRSIQMMRRQIVGHVDRSSCCWRAVDLRRLQLELDMSTNRQPSHIIYVLVSSIIDYLINLVHRSKLNADPDADGGPHLGYGAGSRHTTGKWT